MTKVAQFEKNEFGLSFLNGSFKFWTFEGYKKGRYETEGKGARM
jgi:hypothetical protein